MPNIVAKVPADTFSKDQLTALGEALTKAAHKAEGIPDNPQHHVLTWVMIEEVAAHLIFVAGRAVVPHRVPIIVIVYPPQGVLDSERRAILAREVDTAVRQIGQDFADRISVSCIAMDVAEGSWGGNGDIWTLEKISAVAGYKHQPRL